MEYAKTDFNRALLGFVLIVAMICVGFGCKPKATKETAVQEKGEVEIISLDSLYPIFGKAEEDTSGIYDFSQGGMEAIISYRYFPLDPDKIQEEIGSDLAPKIKNFYTQFPQVDRAVFDISLPQSEELGGWKQYVSFDFTRKLFTETEWTDLMSFDLLRIAENVRYYE